MPISVSSVPRFELAPLRWRLKRFAQTQVKSLLARLLKAREKWPAMMPLGERWDSMSSNWTQDQRWW